MNLALRVITCMMALPVFESPYGLYLYWSSDKWNRAISNVRTLLPVEWRWNQAHKTYFDTYICRAFEVEKHSRNV
jgi:hypothetical protein